MTKRIILVSLLAVLVLVFACVWLASRLDWDYILATLDGGTHTMRYESIHYVFDPRVVATAVPDGDFLTPVPPDSPIPTSEPIAGLDVLDEERFYAIASRAVEKEKGLEMIGIGFGSPCAYAGSGLDGMDFEYIKRRNEITDLEGFPYLYVGVWVRFGKVRYYTYVFTYVMDAAARETRQPALNYEGLAMKALEAIRIAEEHGGREFRSQVSDACEIHGGLRGDPPVWSVRYRKEGEESDALEFRINAENGEVITVEQ